jgi:RNA polymerase sigma-70 factor (ECF subfamily)
MTEVFEAHRGLLLALGYRMLGDRARAEELVQEAWLRWAGRDVAVEDPRAWLVTVMSRLCLSELRSARARREESRGNRLPEPVAEARDALGDVPYALLVASQRLTPAERAVLLLHDVLDLGHAEIGPLVGRSEPTCRKLLQRARVHVAEEARRSDASPTEHAALVRAFVAAAVAGDVRGLVELLTADVVLVTDGGPDGAAIEGFRSLGAPLAGAEAVARFVAAVTSRAAPSLVAEEVVLNGRAAVLLLRGGRPFAVVQLGSSGALVGRIWFQADPARLTGLPVGSTFSAARARRWDEEE